MGGSLLIGPCMKPRVALVFLASMDVVDLILWFTISLVSICGRLFLPVQTVQRVLSPAPRLKESALLIPIGTTCLGAW